MSEVVHPNGRNQMTDNKNSEDKIVYSKITGERIPPCKRTQRNEPNLYLMAKCDN